MALIKCKECGKEISNQAKACPHCGCPIEASVHSTQSKGVSYTTATPKTTTAQSKSSSAGKNSGMSILAFILSLLGCTFIIALVLAIVDLTKKDGRKKGLAIAAIVISCIWLLLVAAGMGSNKDTVKSEPATSQSSQEIVDETRQDTEPSEELPETPSPTEKIVEEDMNGKVYPGETWENKYLRIKYTNCYEFTDYNQYNAPEAGNKIVCATFEFENIGNTDETVMYTDFHGYADGYQVNQSYSPDGTGLDFTVSLSAGRKGTGIVAFEVPEDATEIEFEFSPNFWSSEKVIFLYQ